MSQQRVAEIRTSWEFAFGNEPSPDAVVRMGGWAQAFGVLPVARAIEKTASTEALASEEEALEVIRITLKHWKSRGWL